MDDEAVIAATRQWIEKAVIGLNLCPFAKAVYVKNQVRLVVSRASHLDGLLEDLDRELDFLAAADPDEVDTTLLIHPTLLADFLDFNDFTQLAEAAVGEHGERVGQAAVARISERTAVRDVRRRSLAARSDGRAYRRQEH